MTMGEWETCRRCGRLRLPARWYKRGYEWLGHADPCIGVDPEPHVSGREDD